MFARLPQLVERAGTGANGVGSITAFYTVLTDAEDANDPIADAARAILDGHVILSRRLAEAGHFPAIDIEASVSRAMHQITRPEHQRVARQFRHLYALYLQNRDLMSVGAYKQGANRELDKAVAMYPRLCHFLRQEMHEKVSMRESLAQLEELLAEPAA